MLKNLTILWTLTYNYLLKWSTFLKLCQNWRIYEYVLHNRAQLHTAMQLYLAPCLQCYPMVAYWKNDRSTRLNKWLAHIYSLVSLFSNCVMALYAKPHCTYSYIIRATVFLNDLVYPFQYWFHTLHINTAHDIMSFIHPQQLYM